MVSVHKDAGVADTSQESIAYIRQMLGELRSVADEKGADMLCYLLEMAYVEAGDIMAGRRALSAGRAKGHKAAGMPMEPAGKVKF